MRNRVCFYCYMLVLSLIFSCKKQQSIHANQASGSGFAFVSAVLGDTSRYNIFVGGVKVNGALLDTKKLAVFPSSEYVSTPAGNQQLSFISAAGAAISTSVQLPMNTYSTVFLNGPPGKPVITVFQDSLLFLTDSSAAVRFINLSPDQTTVNFTLTSSNNTPVAFSNIRYQQSSGFRKIKLTPEGFSFQVFIPGITQPIVNRTVLTKFGVGKNYTIYLVGQAASKTLDIPLSIVNR